MSSLELYLVQGKHLTLISPSFSLWKKFNYPYLWIHWILLSPHEINRTDTVSPALQMVKQRYHDATEIPEYHHTEIQMVKQKRAVSCPRLYILLTGRINIKTSKSWPRPRTMPFFPPCHRFWDEPAVRLDFSAHGNLCSPRMTFYYYYW